MGFLKKISFVWTFWILSFYPLFAGTVGTTTADILKINQGARPAAMGGAYTAIGDDAYSIDYNPAGLALIPASQLILLHLDSLAQIEYEYLTFATPVGFDGDLALNLVYRHSPPIDNQNGNPPTLAPDDVLLRLGYAQKLSDSLRGGLLVEYLKSDLDTYSASAIAFDAGIQLDKLPYGLKAGLSVQNVGTGMQFDQSDSITDPLPVFVRVGLGDHQVVEGRDLNVGLEVFKPSDQDFKMGLGAEFWLFPGLFAFRGGYKFESLGQFTGNVFDNYSLGCTLTQDFDGDDFSLDIAYNPADFSSADQDTFFFALNLKFNQLRLL